MGLLLKLLLAGGSLSLIQFIITLFFTTTFIPYQVQRVQRRVPVYTYSLMGINIFVFLFTIFVANLNLPIDRVEGQQAIDRLLAEQKNPKPAAAAPSTAPAPTPSAPAQAFHAQASPDANAAANEAEEAEKPDDASAKRAADGLETLARGLRRDEAAQLQWEKTKTADDWKTLWQIQHADSSYVLEPHYSIQNIFAYRAAQPTLWGLLGSMFLHGSFMHLIGNMLYLWVFGRALEETLGPAIYVGAYLLCGIAATLLYHVITMVFTPQSAVIPSLGASGAIAGVLGLFALRFYRTPVKIFYVQALSLLLVTIAAIIGGVISAVIVGMLTLGAFGTIGFFCGFLAVWVGFLIFMRRAAFGSFNLFAAYSIGIWLAVFNLMPGIFSLFSSTKQGGTAYWAHIGGFGFGMLYALLIGSKSEGALEYALEDAHKAYDQGQMEDAIERATNVLSREPNNAGAFDVIAKAHDQRGNEVMALDNYEIAIQKHFQAGEREAAVNTYLHSLSRNPGFILDPKIQMALGSQMARMALYQESAENLAKIPFTFPESPEGELALLRAAQVYLEQLNEPDMAAHLLHTMLERYPDTQWLQQVERNLRMAQFQLNPPEETAAPEPEAPAEQVNTRVQAQLPQIKR